jgi:hypothetical protein
MSAAITEFAARVEALRAIAEGEILGECFSNDEILSLELGAVPGSRLERVATAGSRRAPR